MLDRFVLLEDFVTTVFYKQCKNDKCNSIPKPLLPEERKVSKDVLLLLKPFEHVTTELCSEDATSSKVLPVINCLNLALESAEPSSEVAMVLQLYLKEEVKKYLTHFMKSILYLQKPIRVSKKFTSQSFNSSKKCWRISKEMNTVGEFPIPNLDIKNDAKVSNTDDLSSFHDDAAQKAELQRDRDEPGGVSSELRNYLSQPTISRKVDPLKYWEAMKHSFPYIYSVARKYLSVPATSVPSGRFFSKAGTIDSDKRRRLDPERPNKIVFLSSIRKED